MTEEPAAAQLRHATWPVVLVSMPFMDIDRPSIQLGLLKRIGEAHGFPVRTLHANLDFAARIGIDHYQALAEQRGPMLGDWLFSVEAFGDAAPDQAGALLTEFAGELSYLGLKPEQIRDHLRRIRDVDVPGFLDDLITSYPWQEARVVGFSCTFQQSIASFALGRRLKKQFPHLVTVFGGANFDGEMGVELVRSVECIDLAVIGEGDAAFPGLLHALAAGADPTEVPGVAARSDGAVLAAAAAPLERLTDLPVPDYTEYFERAESLGLLSPSGRRQTWIPFESARGCWWGAKHHCTFCGLNADSMTFRSKPAGRVLAELAEQARRYGSFRFQAVDNIFDPAYFTELLPAIIDARADYEIFYEVKANLGREKLKLLAQAGVRHLQPGIESLNSGVLRLMNKGVRAAQNVNQLRWARYYDISVAWSILAGFPGETADQYADQALAARHLIHLQPPSGAERIWLERFSPLFSATDQLRDRRPERSYRYVYPASVDLDRVAYFFDYSLVDPLPDSTYAELQHVVADWNAAWQGEHRPTLTYWAAPGLLQIHDGRTPGREGTYTFHDQLADIYLACSDRPMTASGVRRALHADLPLAAIETAFREFQRRGLMFIDESLALALALPATPGR